MNSIHALDNFWKRYNKVDKLVSSPSPSHRPQALLDKLAVEHELKSVGEENEQLRALLKRYLDGLDEPSTSKRPHIHRHIGQRGGDCPGQLAARGQRKNQCSNV